MSCTLLGSGSTLVYFPWRKYDESVPRPMLVAYWDITVEDPQNGAGYPYPDYTMMIDTTTGSSNLTVASIRRQDNGTYLCESSYAPTPDGGNPKKDIHVIVSGNACDNIIDFLCLLCLICTRSLVFNMLNNFCFRIFLTSISHVDS